MGSPMYRLDSLEFGEASRSPDGSWALRRPIAHLRVDSLPADYAPLMLAGRVQHWDDTSDQPAAFITDPAGREVAGRESAERVALTDCNGPAGVAAFVFTQVRFLVPGSYTVTLMIEGIPFASCHFQVELDDSRRAAAERPQRGGVSPRHNSR